MMRLAKGDSGSFFIDSAIALAVLAAVIFSFLTIPALFVRKQEIDYMARAIARQIERDGRIGDGLYELIDALEGETGLAPYISWEGHFTGASQKLQIRDKFTVTVSCELSIKLIEPTFTAPLRIIVPISKTVSGVSEVYWKELA
jgi:hypothetical protein